MNDRDRDLPQELDRQLREWASTEPAIDEQQLRRNLLERIPDRKFRTSSRVVLLAAAASLLAVLIGLENTRQPPQPGVAGGEVVHETGANVILVLREGGEPIYIATEPPNNRVGE
jgi:hypothetical protein